MLANNKQTSYQEISAPLRVKNKKQNFFSFAQGTGDLRWPFFQSMIKSFRRSEYMTKLRKQEVQNFRSAQRFCGSVNTDTRT